MVESEPGDPLTFLGVTVILLATVWTAGWIPTLRGTRVDPGVTMRAE